MKLKPVKHFKSVCHNASCFFDIKKMLVLIFCILSLLSILAITWNTLQVIEQYNEVEQTANANHISQLALQVNNTLAQERGFTATLLANRNLYKKEVKKQLLQLREETSRDLKSLRIELERQPDMRQFLLFIKQLDIMTKQFLHSRQQADLFLNQQQDFINYQQWTKTITAIIEDIIKLNNTLLSPIKEEAHLLQYGILIKNALFTFIENAGRERALISTVISQNRPFTRNEYKLLDNYQNTTNLTAKRLDIVLNFFPETSDIVAAQHKLNKIYFQNYQQLRSVIINHSQNAQPYPIDSISWFHRATEAVNAILILSKAINQHFIQDIEKLKAKTFHTIISLIVTVFIVIIVFSTGFFITYCRILSPLMKLEKSANFISKGDFTHSLSPMVNDEFGKVGIAFEVMRDYLLKDKTRREKVEQELLKLNTAIEQSVSSVVITDINGITEYVNPQFYKTSGYSINEVIGQKFNFIRSGKTPESIYRDLWTTIKEGKVWQKELLNRKKNGELYWTLVSISPVCNQEGLISNFISIQHDITERKQLEERLNYMAYHDELTTLPNRFLLIDRYKQITSGVNRKEQKVALLLLDLDQFKLINDNLGHHVGDKVLIEVSNRLKSIVRDSDTIARYGGDEFIILANSFVNIASIFELIKRINDVFKEVITVEEHQLHVTSSIGISIWPDDGKEMEVLLGKADTAMYHAKDMGRGCFQFYTKKLNLQSSQRLQMENNLREAISNHEFELFYQPQIHIESGELIGVEALIRWNHKELGSIPPLEFIPLAEESNLIKPIGEWVLQTACAQAKKWQDMGYSNLTMAVNLSARQLDDKHFVQTLKKMLKSIQNKSSCLEIEITETSVMNSPDKMHDILNEIKMLDVKLAMDDFGTGFSSLSYLRRFPFDKIKIDRSFITDITHNTEDAAIVKSIIELSHSLNKTVIAEGVETLAQAKKLTTFNCDEIQGYLISKPLSAAQFEENFLIQDFLTYNEQLIPDKIN